MDVGVDINKLAIIDKVCEALAANQLGDAEKIMDDGYKFKPWKKPKSSFSYKQKMEIFIRDGFVDGYSGERLIFPGTLLVISEKLGITGPTFPYHRNWKMDACHIAYWELVPTIDHIKPLAREGDHVKENWILTSQMRNSVKAQWTLEELEEFGWKKCSADQIRKWDGMTRWFFKLTDGDKSLLQNNCIKQWHRVANKFRNDPAFLALPVSQRETA
jgi:hypothetical protein